MVAFVNSTSVEHKVELFENNGCGDDGAQNHKWVLRQSLETIEVKCPKSRSSSSTRKQMMDLIKVIPNVPGCAWTLVLKLTWALIYKDRRSTCWVHIPGEDTGLLRLEKTLLLHNALIKILRQMLSAGRKHIEYKKRNDVRNTQFWSRSPVTPRNWNLRQRWTTAHL